MVKKALRPRLDNVKPVSKSVSAQAPQTVTKVASAADRRRYPRRAKPFQAVYWPASDMRFPAVGLDIGGGGLCLLTQQPIPTEVHELSVVVLIDEKPVPVTGMVKWNDTIKYKDKDHFRYGLKLLKIADGDWDTMMNSLSVQLGLGTPANGSVLTAKQRDQLIPARVQEQISDALIKRERLDPPQHDCLPLTEYKFEGYTMRKSVPMYKLSVRSKARNLSGRDLNEFRTTILVLVEGNGVVIAD